MSLEGVFFISLSIQAILVSVFLVVILFYLVKIMHEVGVISQKVQEGAEKGIEVAEEAKEYVGKIGKTALDYLVVRLIDSVKRKK